MRARASIAAYFKQTQNAMPWTLLEHTTDVRLRVEGHNAEELFSDALAGLTDTADSGFADDAQTVRQRISAESPDMTALLVDFLNEVLLLMHTNKVAFTDVRFLKLEDRSLAAVVEGRRVTGFDEDIKAVTYHEADIVRDADGMLHTNLIFDI